MGPAAQVRSYAEWHRAWLLHHGLVRPDVHLVHVELEGPCLRIGPSLAPWLLHNQGCQWLPDVDEGPEARCSYP